MMQLPIVREPDLTCGEVRLKAETSNSPNEGEAEKTTKDKVDTNESPPGCPMPLEDAIRRVVKAPWPPPESESDGDSPPDDE